jgi:hypothetical protein
MKDYIKQLRKRYEEELAWVSLYGTKKNKHIFKKII